MWLLLVVRGISPAVSGEGFFTSGIQNTVLVMCPAFWTLNLSLILTYFP